MKIILVFWLWFAFVSGTSAQVQEVALKKQAFREALLSIKSYEEAIDKERLYWGMYQGSKEGIEIMEELLTNPQTPPAIFCYISHRLYLDYLHLRNIHLLENLEKTILNTYQNADKFAKKQFFDALLIRGDILSAIGALSKKSSFWKAKEAIEFLKEEAIKLNEHSWIFNYYVNMAKLYKQVANYHRAIDMQMNALKVLDSLQSKDFKRYGEVEYYLGQLHYDSKNYQKAISHWEKSLQIAKKHNVLTRYKTLVANNIGISYKALKQYDLAIPYLEKTIQEAVKQKDTVWVGIATGNIGDIWVLRQEYQKAIPLLEKDVAISLKFQEQNNAVISLAQIAFCYFAIKDYDKALQYYEQALKLYNECEFMMIEHEGIGRFERLLPIYEGISKIYFEKKDFQKAYSYQTQYRSLQDTLQSKNFSEQISLLEEKYQIELKDKEKAILNAQLLNEKMQKWIAFISIFALIALVFGLFWFFRGKMQKISSEKARIWAEKQLETEKNLRLEEEMRAEAEINMLKRQQFEEEIATKERELTTASLMMYEKNEALQKIQEQIKRISEQTTDKVIQKNLKSTIKDLKDELNLEKDWDLFKKQFEQVYPQFFNYIIQTYHELSLTDLRLCAYIRMNLDNKVIAQFLGISADSLRVARHRLRKKINVKDDKELYLLLQNIQ